jgi:hypothetical protein
MDERARRIGENEILFRDVNERVTEVSGAFAVVLPDLEIVCECGALTCTERIRISAEEYARLRADGARFAVKPGHEIPDVETVVERHGGYDVVEKDEGDPATLARSYDPRA